MSRWCAEDVKASYGISPEKVRVILPARTSTRPPCPHRRRGTAPCPRSGSASSVSTGSERAGRSSWTRQRGCRGWTTRRGRRHRAGRVRASEASCPAPHGVHPQGRATSPLCGGRPLLPLRVPSLTRRSSRYLHVGMPATGRPGNRDGRGRHRRHGAQGRGSPRAGRADERAPRGRAGRRARVAGALRANARGCGPPRAIRAGIAPPASSSRCSRPTALPRGSRPPTGRAGLRTKPRGALAATAGSLDRPPNCGRAAAQTPRPVPRCAPRAAPRTPAEDAVAGDRRAGRARPSPGRPESALDLRDHVDAVAVVVDHALDAADLALDPAEPADELLLGRGVAAVAFSIRSWYTLTG